MSVWSRPPCWRRWATGLAPMVQANHQAGRLHFTTDVTEGVAFAELIFIAVGTPPDEDGSADLKHVLAVAGTIGQLMQAGKVVINKSTVPVGTAARVRHHIEAILRDRGVELPLEVVSNPEFLKEGAAVNDCLRPDRIIIGTGSSHAFALLEELYAPFNRQHDRIIQMDERSAELTKYAANAMLATKISFMNEMAGLAERLGADIEEVRKGIGADPRIGYHFIYPGCGYGGSCFPKDVKALIHTASENGCDVPLLRSVEQVNDRQKHRLAERLHQHFGADLSGLTFALWGLAFKPNTDDMREAPSRVLMEAIWAAGGKVQDALLICTEWQQFRAPDFELIKRTLKQPVILDGRNLYDPARLHQRGFTYYAIGRGNSLEQARVLEKAQ